MEDLTQPDVPGKAGEATPLDIPDFLRNQENLVQELRAREQALTNALRYAIDDIADATASQTGDPRSYYRSKIAGYAKVLEGS